MFRESSGCPSGRAEALGTASRSGVEPLGQHNRGRPGSGASHKLPTGRARVQALYEAYINLGLLKQVWDSPLTSKPALEPCFAAAFHGIELCFLLLAEFIADERKYVAKRPRVELVAEDIAAQCKLLTEVIDGELEDEEEEGGEGDRPGGPTAPRLSLTQPFPFEGCPPTTPCPAHSPGLQRLVEAVQAKVGGMTPTEQNSLVKLVLNLTAAFDSFQRWSVGLGIEAQLDTLRAAVGLLPATGRRHRLNLDYAALVRPEAAEATLTGEQYTHAEDFFFRTVHLGTECYAFVAHNRIASAAELAGAGRWHLAAARMGQASRVLHYLGSHMLLLTRMNLRDYLQLKVELEGTSGEGSAQVKALRPAITQLFQPLSVVLVGAPCPPTLPAASNSGSDSRGSGSCGAGAGGAGGAAGEVGVGDQEGEEEEGGDALQQALLRIYEAPDQHAALYNYTKALEDLETGLLGGFYYKHFCLASNVIGSDARGTMRRAVQALKSTYETPLFPRLDAVRCQLGKKMDSELAAFKGRMMDSLLAKHSATPAAAAAGGPGALPACPFSSASAQAAAAAPTSCSSAQQVPASNGGDSTSKTIIAPAPPCRRGPASSLPAALEEGEPTGFEAVRQRLYGWGGVPPHWRELVAEGLQGAVRELGLACWAPNLSGSAAGKSAEAAGAAGLGPRPLAFLTHAWGACPPLAQLRAARQAAGWEALGNPSWSLLLEREMPQAAAHIKRLLGMLPEADQGPDQGSDQGPDQGPGQGSDQGSDQGSGQGSGQGPGQGPDQGPDQGSDQGSGQGSGQGPGQGSGQGPGQGAAAGAVSVQFGSNTHELVARLLTALLPLGRAARARAPLRVLTSDSEFVSFTRQASRLLEAGLVSVEALPAEPADSFPERCCAAVRSAAQRGEPYHLIYVSQITYAAQRTLLPDVTAFVEGVLGAAAPKAAGPEAVGARANRSTAAAAAGTGCVKGAAGIAEEGEGGDSAAEAGVMAGEDRGAAAGPPPGVGEPPLVVVDGSHAWMAVPMNLGRVANRCCFVAGLLKHAGCGPNCAFLTLPSRLRPRPLLTGWLADPSVLAPGSEGTQIGSQVDYCPELALQGGTPAYALPLLTFNHTMALWLEIPQAGEPPSGGGQAASGGQPRAITLPALHSYVLGLQAQLLEGLAGLKHPRVNLGTLLPPARDPACRSHTLVFAQPDTEQAAQIVKRLGAKGVLVDSRGRYVRVGLGAGHSTADVAALLAALAADFSEGGVSEGWA